ncbi:MAG: Sir2 family NAD-dependent protein deacetylase [Pseudomonadota bacterium]
MNPLPSSDAIGRAASLVASADAIVVAAGAGIGVDSGLPDFRGNAGFWKAYPSLAADGTAFTDIASPTAFHENPRRAWGFYGHRLALYRRTAPHAGFAILRRWGESTPHGSFVFTSNVDGHFQRAGFSPQRIDECHGSIHRLQCLGPCSPALWPATGLEPVLDEVRCALLGPLPSCPYCGGIARPNVLMFDDWAWNDTLREQQAQRCRGWLDGVRRPLVIEIGAGMDIPTVRHFSTRVVLQHGGSLLRINPREAQIGKLPGVALAGGALACLASIDAALAGGAR